MTRNSRWIKLGLFLVGVVFASGILLRGSSSVAPSDGHLSFLLGQAYAQNVPSTPEIEFEPIPVESGNSPVAPNPETSEPSTPSTPELPTIPISLVGSFPQNEATDVPIDSQIELQFSDLLDDSIEELELTIEPEIGLKFNILGERLILEPAEELDFSTEYQVILVPQTGIPLTEEVQFSFKTEPQYTYDIDVQPLLEVSCVGCHGAFGTSRSSFLDTYSSVLQFLEPGDESSLLIDPKFTRPHARRRVGTRLTGSQSIAQRFMRINGFPMTKLGSWSAEEIEIVTTWIVQDEAIETSASRQARLAEGT